MIDSQIGFVCFRFIPESFAGIGIESEFNDCVFPNKKTQLGPQQPTQLTLAVSEGTPPLYTPSLEYLNPNNTHRLFCTLFHINPSGANRPAKLVCVPLGHFSRLAFLTNDFRVICSIFALERGSLSTPPRVWMVMPKIDWHTSNSRIPQHTCRLTANHKSYLWSQRGSIPKIFVSTASFRREICVNLVVRDVGF